MPSENDQDWTGKIKKWLEIQGHSLEMRVAKKFAENSFAVSQFEHYVDQESKAVKQMDVVASISKRMGHSLVTVNLIIECKYAKSKPWVILITQKKLDKFTFFSRQLQGHHPSVWKSIPTLQGRLIGCLLQMLSRLQEIDKFAVEPAGYSVLETRFDSNYKPDPNQLDYAFEAVVQVSKSVEAHDAANEVLFKNSTRDYESGMGIDTGFRKIEESTEGLSLDLSIAIPVVLISGVLFESHLDNSNEIVVSEIPSGFVLTPYKRHETRSDSSVTLSPVVIVTEDNLDTFIPKIREMMMLMLEQETAIQDLVLYEQSKLSPRPNLDF
jgi:hypothetical protein